MEFFDFTIDLPVDIDLAKAEGTKKRRLAGYSTTDSVDKDGEELIKGGLDFSPLAENGFINYDHQRRDIGGVKMPLIIGFPNEVVMKSRGLWVSGELLQGDATTSEQIRLADEMWSLGMALKKAGNRRRLAYSIEGKVIQRRGKKLVKTQASQVALTHKPVNGDCTVEMFMKSLCCGKCSPDNSLYNPANSCLNKDVVIGKDQLPELEKSVEKAASTASHGALLLENLDRGLSSALYGDDDVLCKCYDRTTGRFHKSIEGAHNHMTGCLGFDSPQAFRLLKRLVVGAGDSADLATFVKTAGLIRQ